MSREFHIDMKASERDIDRLRRWEVVQRAMRGVEFPPEKELCERIGAFRGWNRLNVHRALKKCRTKAQTDSTP